MKVDNLYEFDRSLDDRAGYLGIFHEIGCIGDSLASGEFVYDNGGKRGYWDAYDFSWVKIIERTSGMKCTNFASGGLMAKDLYTQADTFHAPWHENNHLFEKMNVKPAYFLALGLNDINHVNIYGEFEDYKQGLGDPKSDINLEDFNLNADSFAGWYGKIIQRIHSLDSSVKFFLVGIPNDHKFPRIADINERIKGVAEVLPNCYYLDLYDDAPDYDEVFYERFFESNHMNAMGYVFTAKLLETLANRVIWENYGEFQTVQFFGTNLKRLVTVKD